MYELYYLPDACSLATHTVLHELGQPVRLIDRNVATGFTALNPVGAVPVLVDGDLVLREGVAILIHLLETHDSPMLPSAGPGRRQAIESMLFANATMHPAYGRLFFIAEHIRDEAARAEAFQAAVEAIDALWRVVDRQVGDKAYLDGDDLSVADVLLTVYSRWGAHFPVRITLGANSERMIANVLARPSFQRALAAERAQGAAA